MIRLDVYKRQVDGLRTVVSILPTLVGLMAAVGILRVSGCLDYIAGFIKPVTDLFGFPSELVPLTVVKMFSSSAATGPVSYTHLDVYKRQRLLEGRRNSWVILGV